MTASIDSSITFGQWLRRRRRALRLTQATLAKHVGYTEATLQKLEQDLRRPSHALVSLLADALALTDTERARCFQLAAALPSAAEASREPDEGATHPGWSPPPPPRPPVALVGRAAEQAALVDQLCAKGQRLLTLIGPGGIGKTSLALQVAADIAAGRVSPNPFPDGVAVAALAAIAAVAQVPQAISAAIGMPLAGGRPAIEQLIGLLRDRTLLLVLDNCEQLLDPGEGESLAALLAALLEGAPQLMVLATSRERLRLRDEQVMILAGLDLPASDSGPRVEQSPAVHLFVERARRTHPAFGPTAGERADVVRLCRRLGGIPLAIELAAAWTHALSPREIADELDRSLDLLTSDARDINARHRSVRVVLDHSWRRLNDAERRALARLSVIAGSGDREAAAAVAGATLPILSSLIDKSLVQRLSASGITRYRLHELVRQYAAEQLAAEHPAAQREAESRHTSHYAAHLQRLIAPQTGGASPEAWARLAHDFDNIRSAWIWAATAGDVATIRGMARGLMLLTDQHSLRLDAVALFAQAAEALQSFGHPVDAARGLVLGFKGYFLLLMRPAEALQPLREGIALLEAAGDDEGRAELLLHLGTAELAAANFASAHAHYALATQLAEGQGNHFVRLWATLLSSTVDLYTGAIAAAHTCAAMCLAEWRSQGVDRGIVTALSGLSEAALYQGRLPEAEAYAQEALRISSTSRDTPGVGRTLHDLGMIALAAGNLDEAYYLLVESCTTLRAVGDLWPYALSRALLISAETQRGQLADARNGSVELLRLVHDGLAIILPDTAYGLALVLSEERRDSEALAILIASADAPGRLHTLQRCTALRTALERRLSAEGRAGALAIANGRPLLVLLEELSAQPPAGTRASTTVSARQPPVVPQGALYIDETHEILSPREVEVLRLLTTGMSNQALAEALVISLHTAKHHVANILQKLGVTSRTEAALRGRALDLTPHQPRQPGE
jgi:predicted ATPase/DNA-binding NarL/FixJ family response regulator/transcriptional regulator with XRE-family HTH domain